jgi:hypothetical protein
LEKNKTKIVVNNRLLGLLEIRNRREPPAVHKGDGEIQ